MRTKTIAKLGLPVAVAALGVACSSSPNVPVATSWQDIGAQPFSQRAACPATGKTNTARCLAHIRTYASSGAAVALATPPGLPDGALGATDLESAYNLPTSGGSGMTIAIIDAQDLPTAESDLAAYRSFYGLPPCTSASGCFTKVNQDGAASPLPTADPTEWGVEIGLDIEMASAACPNCKILLVEANSQADTDLGTAVNTAATLGASVISNSYAWSELDANVTTDNAYYNHPGVAIFASSGDYGYDESYDGMAVGFPSASPYVMAVGGTTLTQDTTTPRGWSEVAWSDAGSGCSMVFAQPSWQQTSVTQCAMRMGADISAVADIEIAYYENGAWGEVGGTSVASPLVAGIFAVTNNATVSPSFAWNNPSYFYDVTSGANGTCSPALWCTSGAGYDGPTGWGTPNGALLAHGMDGGTDAGDGGSDAGDAGDAGPANLLVNGGFETGDLSGWTVLKGQVTASTAEVHGGSYSALLGSTAGYDGTSNLAQNITIPSTGTTTLSFWGNSTCAGKDANEYERVRVLSASGATLDKVLSACTTSGGWVQTTYDLTPHAGKTVTLRFGDAADKAGLAYWYLDDAQVTNQ
jgi:subtilase family serine protease